MKHPFKRILFLLFLAVISIFVLFRTCKEEKTAHENGREISPDSVQNYAPHHLSCEDLPEIFDNYEDAHKKIHASEFAFSEKINTSRSSWIRGASYYSCDGKYGFLSILTDSKEYIHQNVPIHVWKAFKNAASFGSFYNKNIKHRYRLKIKMK
jgi:hypothetical protein